MAEADDGNVGQKNEKMEVVQEEEEDVVDAQLTQIRKLLGANKIQ